MWIWIIIIAGMGFAFQLIDKILFDKVLNNTNSEKNVQTEYQEKPIMTASEINFYNKIKTLRANIQNFTTNKPSSNYQKKQQ